MTTLDREEAHPANAEQFASVARSTSNIPGWLTPAQALKLHSSALAVPPGGCVVEIGSHHGRSTIVLASGLGERSKLFAIDPFPPDWKYGTPDVQARFAENLDRAGVANRVEHLPVASTTAVKNWDQEICLLYIDGKHDVVTVLRDLQWTRFLRPGGDLFVHDAFSSVGVTLALLLGAFPARELRYVGRTGSLAHFKRERPTLLQRVSFVQELPWWARNVAIKVLLRLRLRRLTVALGHHDTADPY